MKNMKTKLIALFTITGLVMVTACNSNQNTTNENTDSSYMQEDTAAYNRIDTVDSVNKIDNPSMGQ